jgi:hypothetical protein
MTNGFSSFVLAQIDYKYFLQLPLRSKFFQPIKYHVGPVAVEAIPVDYALVQPSLQKSGP